MSNMPGNAGTEQTTTVIIGTGLSGLAVAAELRRRVNERLSCALFSPHATFIDPANSPTRKVGVRARSPARGPLRRPNVEEVAV